MRSVRIALSFCFLLLATPAWAQQQSPSASPAARTLLQQSVAALTNGLSLKDVSFTATVHRTAGSAEETGTAELKALATGEARADFTYPSGVRSEVQANSDQGPVGSWSNPDGTSGTTALHNLLVDSAWFCPALMLSRFTSSQGMVISDVARETRDSLAVLHVSISRRFASLPGRVSGDFQRLSQMEVYLDASTLLPVALTFRTHPDNNAGLDIPVEIRFSDYRTQNGVQIPFHIQKLMNGGLTIELEIQKADINTGLSPSSFAPVSKGMPSILGNWGQKRLSTN